MWRDRRAVRALSWGFGAAVVGFGGAVLVRQWAAVQAVRAAHPIRWGLLAAASLAVLASYGVLIQTWRATVRAWGERLAWRSAATIWLVSNLGRYVPGKVWQLGAMSVLAQRHGVSASAAVGSALVVSLLHVVVGFGVIAATGPALLGRILPAGAPLGPVLVALGSALVLLPWLLPRLGALAGRWRGRPITIPPLPVRALGVAALGSAGGWLLSGAAFHLLTRATTGAATGDVAGSVAVFTLSYLAGFLALIAPGGIGVREAVLGGLLVAGGGMTPPEATWVVVVSRLWLTVLEIVPGAVLLLVVPSLRPTAAPPP